MKYIPNKVDDLKDMLKKTDFKSPDVEDFIFSLDAEEINSFKKYFIDEGVISKKKINLLTKYFKNFLDIEFLDQVISSSEKAFKSLGDFIKSLSTEHEEYLGKDWEPQIRMAKEIISNKEMIFKKLKGLKTRIEKYQQEF